MGSYSHTQRAPLWLAVQLVAVAMLIAAWQSFAVPVVPSILLGSGILVGLLGLTVVRLTIADESDRLGIRFGPLPLFSVTIRYSNIADVAAARTTVLDGWGIHFHLGGGLVMNLWGRDCVKINLRQGHWWGSCYYLGTDDAAGLADFLKTRINSE